MYLPDNTHNNQGDKPVSRKTSVWVVVIIIVAAVFAYDLIFYVATGTPVEYYDTDHYMWEYSDGRTETYRTAQRSVKRQLEKSAENYSDITVSGSTTLSSSDAFIVADASIDFGKNGSICSVTYSGYLKDTEDRTEAVSDLAQKFDTFHDIIGLVDAKWNSDHLKASPGIPENFRDDLLEGTSPDADSGTGSRIVKEDYEDGCRMRASADSESVTISFVKYS